MAEYDDEKRKHEGEEFTEFALVRRDRDSFDRTAWFASLAGRLRMSPLTDAALDPGLLDFTKQGHSLKFVGDGRHTAAVKPAQERGEFLGFVQAVEVVADS